MSSIELKFAPAYAAVYSRLDALTDTSGSLATAHRHELITKIDQLYQTEDLSDNEYDLIIQRLDSDKELSYFEKDKIYRDLLDRRGCGWQIQKAKDELVALEQRRQICIYGDNPDLPVLEDLLAEATSLQSPDFTIIAPFKNYKQNNDDAWQFVPRAQFEDYARQLYFMNPQAVYQNSNAQTRACLTIKSRSLDSLQLPLRFMTFAQGFDSWLGRGLDGTDSKSTDYWLGKNIESYTEKSRDVMRTYAAQNSDLPPVSEVNLYIQPDGTAVGDNSSGDSHRLAAAFLRGQTELAVQDLNLYLLDSNIFKSTA